MPAPDPIADEPTRGERIVGSFALGRKLGEGGMGTVYEAAHLRSGHRVAVKLLHAEVTAKPGLMRRLRIEAQAANRVPSRGAVQVLDCVEADGTAFLVMERLTGDSLRTLLGRHATGLWLGPALVLLTRLAQIMAAAHAVGVVHRDLKPANIFLIPAEDAAADAEPDLLRCEIKIIDFGLAKLQSDARPLDSPPDCSLTQDGMLIGTAKYLAPEQAMDPGASDGLVDVYALGVVAYEVLAGQPPFAAESAWELVSMHLRDTPAPLRARRPEVPQAVAELVEQMLAKTPVLRPSMAQVHERLQALRVAPSPDPEPGPRAAAPPPAAPRSPVRRWRRLRAVLAFCAGVTVLLGGLAFELRRQRQAQRQKEVALEGARQLVRLIGQRFQDVPGAAAATREMFDVTVTLLDRLRAQSPADAQLDQDLIHVRLLRGQHLRNHGNLADAQADFQQAVVLGEALMPRLPTGGHRAALASAYDSLADTQEQLASLKQAQVNYLRALSLRQTLLREQPENVELHRDLALSNVHLGDLADSMGQSAETSEYLEAARRDLEPLWKAEPDNPKYRTVLIGVYYRLAKLLPVLGRTADGMAVALQASELQARQLALEPRRDGQKQLMARVQQELGAVRQRSGDLDGAAKAFAEALQLHRSLVQLDSKDPQYRRGLSDSLRNAADLSLQRGAVDAAEQLNQEALQLDEALTREDPAHRGYRWRVVTNYRRLGDIAFARGQQAAARTAYQRAVELQESLVLADPHNAQQRRRLAQLLEKAGAQLLSSGDLPMAQARLSQGLQIDEELLRSDPPRSEYRQAVAAARQQLAAVLRQRGQLREAEQELTAALAMQMELARTDRENALVRKEQLATLVELRALAPEAPRAAALRTQAEALLRELADHHALEQDVQLLALRMAIRSATKLGADE